VSDNGNAPASIITAWSQTGGPAGVTFGNANSLSTTAGFPSPGVYQLQLSAGNGQAATVSELTVNAMVPTLALLSSPGGWQLSWPGNNTNWLLQYQSNPPAMGIGPTWLYASPPATSPFTIPLYPGAGSLFYRLVLTNQ
jgi:hypothetical protein